MKINVLESKKKRAVLEIEGIDSTLCNAVRKELWNDSSVKSAGYHISHPLIGIPKIVVETDGKEEPLKALQDAVKRTKSDFAKLRKSIEK